MVQVSTHWTLRSENTEYFLAMQRYYFTCLMQLSPVNMVTKPYTCLMKLSSRKYCN